MFFENLINNIVYKLGYIPEKELIIRSVSKEKRKKIRDLQKKLSNISALTDVNSYTSMSRELITILKDGQGLNKHRKKDAISLVSMSDLYGYKPGLSRLYDLFSQNPMGVYAFVARHHPVIRACIQVILDEITNDGFALIAEKGTNKKRMKEVYRKT